MKNKAIILLSGGLDSVVSMAKTMEENDVELALFFDYGQKAFDRELKSSSEIAKFYNIDHKTIKLDWLKDISTSSLNTKENIPQLSKDDLDNEEITKQSANAVWVPNRNALFINIAAAIAEANNFSKIILGANIEEGATFKDNTLEFINSVNNTLKYSVNTDIKVIAPLINKNKTEIVEEGIKLNVPFELIFSCYHNSEKHCGLCESCLRLKRALELNNRHDIIKKLFG